jgi:hypothetical protein
MNETFDIEAAKKFLQAREDKEHQENESLRQAMFQKVLTVLKKEFAGTATEVYLMGSIVQPFVSFSPDDEIEVMLKNYQGDRFDIWAKLESELGDTVRVFIYGKFHLQDIFLQYGRKVI